MCFGHDDWSLYGGDLSENGDYGLTDLAGIDFVALVVSLGVEGWRVEQADNLRGDLEWALSLGRPSLLEVMVDLLRSSTLLWVLPSLDVT
ncbi:MAG: thiamine pyrophosphate-dependent enzyme [Dehalococcoidia bacterium]|nr:thiamine pyrophosphate-dependent enzyme [Dehalococcoidia bacterium]